MQRGLKRRETQGTQQLPQKLYRDKLLKLSEQSARAMDLPLSPETGPAAAQSAGTKTKMQPVDTYHSKFDPKKLVCQLDQKLKRIQMISDAADFELTGSAKTKNRRGKQEDSSKRTGKYKDGLGSQDKKGSNWRKSAKAGTKSFGSGTREGKADAQRSGATSPEYNIYSDSDAVGSDNDHSQKEGGSAEQHHEHKSSPSTGAAFGGSAAGSSGDAKPRQTISENRLAQNGGNIVHQKPAVRRRVPGMINDLNPVRPAEEEEAEK